MSGLIEKAKNDWQRFTSDPSGAGVELTFEAPTAEIAVITGLATKHHIGLDTEGNPINTKNVHVSVSEQLLVDEGYPVRVDGEVSMLNHKISYKDSTGILKFYTIRETFPDETIGVITCILDDFE